METKKMNFAGRELPSYLGYGILDERNISFENDVLSADYLLDWDGSIVHRVTWQKDHCEILTQLHDEFNGLSCYPNLNYALSYDFLSRNLSEEKVFEFLTEKAISMGNVYVHKPNSNKNGKYRLSYFPAGLLMVFRLPLPERTDKYAAFLDKIKESDQIKFDKERISYLLLPDLELNVTLYPIVLADFIVPVAFMTSAVRTFSDAGIINPDKKFRLIIIESFQAESISAQLFTGNELNPYFGYHYADCPEEERPRLIQTFSQAFKNFYNQHNSGN